MINEAPSTVENLRRELTRALANAIGHLAAAPDAELVSRRDHLDDLLGRLRQFESQPEHPSGATLALSILVVDPDPTRDWTSDRYQVLDRANDALQGLAFAQELRPDAVVYNLPSYSLRDVSAIADLARVGIALRVVALTDDPADRQRLSVVRRPRLTNLASGHRPDRSWSGAGSSAHSTRDAIPGRGTRRTPDGARVRSSAPHGGGPGQQADRGGARRQHRHRQVSRR